MCSDTSGLHEPRIEFIHPLYDTAERFFRAPSAT
jgi:hypothetical protein